MKIFLFVVLCLFALIGVFAVIGAVRQWWANPVRRIDRELAKMEEEQKRRERSRRERLKGQAR